MLRGDFYHLTSPWCVIGYVIIYILLYWHGLYKTYFMLNFVQHTSRNIGFILFKIFHFLIFIAAQEADKSLSSRSIIFIFPAPEMSYNQNKTLNILMM